MKEKRGRKFVQFQLQSMANLGQWELQWKRQFLVATNATVIQRVLTLSVTKMCNKGDYLFSVFNGFGRFSCFWTLFVFKGLLSFLLLSVVCCVAINIFQKILFDFEDLQQQTLT